MNSISNKHQIKTLLFDIIFDDERRAAELYDDVKQLHYQHLDQLLTECLDEFAPSGVFAQIPRLELDLGQIPYEELDTQLPQRVYAALIQQLKEVFHGLSQQSSPVISQHKSALVLLEHFLLKGYLSWNVRETPSSLLLSLLLEKPNELRKLLSHLGQREQVRKRLVYRFNQVEIRKIFELLLPNDSLIVFQFQKALSQVLGNQSHLHTKKEQIDKEIWFFLLSYLLLGSPATLSINNLIRHTLIKLGRQYHLTFGQLVEGLSQSLDKTMASDHTALKMSVQQLSAQLKLGNRLRANEKRRLSQLSKEEQLELVFRFLKDEAIPLSLVNFSIDELQACFSSWLDKEPQFVIASIRSQEHAKFLLSSLVSAFNEKTLQQLIIQLEPSYHKSIREYHKDLIIVHKRAPLVPTSEKELSESVWEVILEILLFSTGSYFNQKAFLKQLIQQVASHYNVSYHRMIQQLFTATQNLQVSSNRLHYFIDLIQELHSEEQIISAQADALAPLTDLSGTRAENHQKKEDQISFLISKHGGSFLQLSTMEQRKWIIYFLKKGLQQLPIPGLSFNDFERVLTRELEHKPEELIQALGKASSKTNAIRKIVKQFQLVSIHALIKSMVPYQYQEVVAFQEQVLVIQEKDPIVKTSRAELSSSLWELILHILLDNAGSQFNQRSFLKSLIRQIAAHYNLKYEALVIQLHRTATRLVKYSNIFPYFVQLLSAVREEITAHVESDQFQVSSTTSSLAQSLLQEVELILCGKKDVTATAVIDSLSQFLRRFPQLAYDSITVLNEQNKLDLHALIQLPQATFFQLIRVMHPQRAGSWIQLLLQLPRLYEQHPGAFPNRNSFDLSLKRQFIKHFLLKKQANQVSPKDFLLEMAKGVMAEFSIAPERVTKLLTVLDHPEIGKEDLASPVVHRNTTAAPSSLLKILLNPTQKPVNWYALGVKDQADAIQHVVMYEQGALISALYQASVKSRSSFVLNLPEPAFDILIRATNASYKMHLFYMIQGINQRLHEIGFARRNQLVLQLKQMSLLFLLQQETQITGHFLKQIEELLLQHTLPKAFFEQPLDWKMPAVGNLDQSIAQLEQRLREAHHYELSQRSPTQRMLSKLLKEGEKRYESIPYFKDAKESMGQEIFVNNAGLIILNAYLPFFFERCGLVSGKGFTSQAMQERAVLLLQYVFHPEKAIMEEELVMNKLLCGLPVEEVVPTEFTPTENEIETTQQLLAAIIGHWEIISNSTPEGFRESWLWREGKLVEKEKAWELTVEQRAFDVLLDYVPFSLSPASASWMVKPINVHWR